MWKCLLIPALRSPLHGAWLAGNFTAKRTIGAQIRHCQEIGLLNLCPLPTGCPKQPFWLAASSVSRLSSSGSAPVLLDTASSRNAASVQPLADTLGTIQGVVCSILLRTRESRSRRNVARCRAAHCLPRKRRYLYSDWLTSKFSSYASAAARALPVPSLPPPLRSTTSRTEQSGDVSDCALFPISRSSEPRSTSKMITHLRHFGMNICH